ncbi:uncharacterized protein [Diadema antillarum]|uniref:uncharacterized protein n=1 Tax=Diadema antillarum TaxID=105358 RepID=UPI003A860529
MSEELTKLAKLANSAAGDSDLDLKLNTSLASPKMRALHLKDEIAPLGPPAAVGMKHDDKAGIKGMELGKNAGGVGVGGGVVPGNPAHLRMDPMKGGDKIPGIDGGVGVGLKKEDDLDSVFFKDGTGMTQLGPMNMNNQMMTNGPQDDKSMNMLHRQISGYPHPPNYTLPDQQHVYTFSTLLANRAAQAVYTGQTDSILAYHRAQSCKRKFLDPEEDTGAAPNHAGNANTGPGTPQQNSTSQSVDGTTGQTANGQNGKPNSVDGKAMDNMKGKNPSTPQSVPENTENTENSRKTPLESSAPTGGTTKGNKKRKRPNSTSQPLQANLQGGPGGPMQQGMPPSGPSFGPYGPGPYRPGFPPQNMPMRPPMSQAQFHNQPATTETENLDPSALWENPPTSKKTMTTTMAPSYPPDMSPMRMASPNPAMRTAMRSPNPALMMANEPMGPGGVTQQPQGPRPFMSPSHPSQSLPASPVNPYDLPNYKPPQQIDNPTPEQLRHRQERLRTLKEMQRLLFPEDQQSMSPSPGRMMSPTGMPPPPQDPMGQPQGMMSPGANPMMRPMGPSGPMMGPGGPGQHPMMHQGMGPGMHPRMPAQEGLRGVSPEQQRMMLPHSGMMIPPLPPDWENMTPAQRDWYKLQQEFYLEKRRKIMEEHVKMQARMGEFPGPMGPGPGPGPGPMRGDPMMGAHPPGSFPPDMMGLNMGPPPPYPAGPGAMPTGPAGPVQGPNGMQRRSSMSGGIPMGPAGPGSGMMPAGAAGGGPGMSGQNVPFPMSPRMPSPRTSRSNSVPGLQSGAQQPVMSGGPASMNPNSIPPGSSAVQGPGSAPGPVSSASAVPMANTMSPHASVGSPMKPAYRAPTPTASNVPSSQPPPSSSDPIMNVMVQTPGSVGAVEQSPRPNQPGTPVGMDNTGAVSVSMQNAPSLNTPNTSQPGTPNSVSMNSKPASVPPVSAITGNGSQKATPEQTVSKPGDRFVQNTPAGNGSVPAASSAGVGNAPTPTSSAASVSSAASATPDASKPMDVQSQQRLVNFPPSQLNRDKAPNFPPRGEDPQQYASTFYQKAVNKEPQMKGPGRLQHFGSPPMNSPMNPDMPTIGSPSSGMMSPGVMMTSQPGMMPPSGMAPQSGMMSQGMDGPPPQAGMIGPGHSPSGPGMGGPVVSMQQAQMGQMMNPRMAGPSPSMQSQMIPGQGPMMSSARMPQQGGMISPQSSMMSHSMPHQSGMMSPSMGPVDMISPQPGPMPGPMTREQQRMMMSQSRMMAAGVPQGHPMMDGAAGPMPGGPGMMPHPMDRGVMQGMSFDHGMNPGMNPNMMRFSGPRGMPNAGFMEGGMPSGPGRTNMPHPGMMGGGMVQGGQEINMMGMERGMPVGPNMPPSSSGQANSPLSLLQSRFSPPLLPDGKGPKQTLQYFPSNASQSSGQGQSGNPHVNPGLPSGPGSSPAQGPKQIELPFPMEMVTGGMNPSAMNPSAMNPSFPRGPGAGPAPRLSTMMNQELMMSQGYGMAHGAGPSPGPRGQVPGHNPMGYMGPRGMPGYGGMNPGPMGPTGPPYGDPNFGPMGPDPMGPGFSMPK